MSERAHVLICTANKRNKNVGACLILEGGGCVFDHSATHTQRHTHIYPLIYTHLPNSRWLDHVVLTYVQVYNLVHTCGRRS